MHPGDAEHGVVDAVAFEAAVAEDLPGLHAGEDVLDTGADLTEAGALLHQRGWRTAFTVAERVNAWAALVSAIERGYGDDNYEAGQLFGVAAFCRQSLHGPGPAPLRRHRARPVSRGLRAVPPVVRPG